MSKRKTRKVTGNAAGSVRRRDFATGGATGTSRQEGLYASREAKRPSPSGRHRRVESVATLRARAGKPRRGRYTDRG